VSVLPIIFSEAAADAAQKVQIFFRRLGFRTLIICLKSADTASALMPVIEGSAIGQMPVQVWIIPSAALEIEEHHRDRASAARAFVNLPTEKELGPPRLMILLDGEAKHAPDLPNTMVVNLERLLSGEFNADQFCERFGFVRD
jgi:hypothetical protein